ncbi:MAG: heme exporter protein CcmB [Cyclobacteriaceae bacterium]|nr:heme exporter protein CcmB [Cyclobacteriaceae bacterium]
MLLKEVSLLLKKEFVLEIRQKYALNGIILYLASTIFICYLSFNLMPNQLQPLTWNALFWIIILFTAVNAVAKSFLQESGGRLMYYYTLASARGIIISKIIYYTLLLVLLGLTGYLFYSLVLGNPVQNKGLFLLNIVLGSVGIAATLTLISSVAAKAQSNQTLLAVLGLPVLIPVILMTIKISKNALDGLAWSVSQSAIITLLAVDVMVATLAILLFPYIWRS